MGQIAFIIMLINDILNRDCVQIHQTCLLQWPTYMGELDSVMMFLNFSTELLPVMQSIVSYAEMARELTLFNCQMIKCSCITYSHKLTI